MNRVLLTLIIFFATTFFAVAQSKQTVFTQDIDNFWTAFDSTQTTKDSVRQLHFIKTLYVDKGTEGLRAFMQARDYTAELWVKLINQYPEFWKSIRPNTLSIKTKAKEIEASINRFRKLYPGLKDAKMYFTIGGLRSGGTTMGNLVLIGAEIATGNAGSDVSEFPNNWLAGVFKEQSPENIIPLNIHEYVHTQQKGERTNLLGNAIVEGSCDFITELVIEKPMQTNYIHYGLAHEQELKEMFKKEMFTSAYSKWLYNGSNAETVADLGYFMGYRICQSYYENAADKTKAVKEIIELNYADTTAVEAFLKKSEYYTETINKTELLKSFREKQPILLRMEPFDNGDTQVDASAIEMSFVFSRPMKTNAYSINLTGKGKEYFPIRSVVGFSADFTSFKVKVELKPDHVYEFILSNRAFVSADGYPLLKDYTIRFKTKPDTGRGE